MIRFTVVPRSAVAAPPSEGVAPRSEGVAQRFSAASAIVAALAVTLLAQAPDRTHPPQPGVVAERLGAGRPSPAAPAGPVRAQAPDRPPPPQPGPPPALHLPSIQKHKLANGLPVWIVELHEVPVAQVNLVVFSGTANDPPGKYGVASLTAAMLEEGAGSRSALEIADAVDYLGADLGASSATDSSAVRLHVPVSHLAEALPIMADVGLRPSFPKDEL